MSGSADKARNDCDPSSVSFDWASSTYSCLRTTDDCPRSNDDSETTSRNSVCSNDFSRDWSGSEVGNCCCSTCSSCFLPRKIDSVSSSDPESDRPARSSLYHPRERPSVKRSCFCSASTTSRTSSASPGIRPRRPSKNFAVIFSARPVASFPSDSRPEVDSLGVKN